ncbi:hypothetical protein CRE_19849 [Caenorhabditis remanei]|uniref:T20D4.11-like domain-containing protein n=1 Tax=Caenorhabditis remanei TaxID=31234 RepID=E3MTM8_CAERE|nr:hypothetical protein CRE_19849 [Caenorhabditis remanei]
MSRRPGKKNEVAKGIVNSRYPPLKNAWKNYTERYQKYLDCASEQDCYKGKLNESIFENARDYIGTKTYPFDHNCLRLVLEKVYDGGYECTHQFGDDLRNLSAAHTIFKNAKLCFLKIAQDTCEPKYFQFFQQNYDDLMELYTDQPVNNVCTNPSDKFYKMQCESLAAGVKAKAAEIPFLNATSSDVKEIVSLCRECQTCACDGCLFDQDPGRRAGVKRMCDDFETLPANLTLILDKRPKLLEYKCLANMTYLDFLGKQMFCIMGQKDNCALFVVSKMCQQEVMADFEDL